MSCSVTFPSRTNMARENISRVHSSRPPGFWEERFRRWMSGPVASSRRAASSSWSPNFAAKKWLSVKRAPNERRDRLYLPASGQPFQYDVFEVLEGSYLSLTCCSTKSYQLQEYTPWRTACLLLYMEQYLRTQLHSPWVLVNEAKFDAQPWILTCC